MCVCVLDMKLLMSCSINNVESFFYLMHVCVCLIKLLVTVCIKSESFFLIPDFRVY